MAENLVGYGFLNKEKPSVEEVLNTVENLIGNQTSKHGEMNAFISELEDIKEKVTIRERIFYASFGVSDFNELNNKLKEIEDSYAPLLAEGRAIKTIIQQIDFTNIGDDSTPEEIEAAITECLEQFMQEDGREEVLAKALSELTGEEDQQAALSQFIQQNLRLEGLQSKKGRTGRFVLARSGKKVGLGKMIVRYDLDKKKFVLSTEGIEFSGTFKKRLQELLEMVVPNDFKKLKRGVSTFSKTDFRNKINELALSCITDREALHYLIEAIKHGEQFDLNRSISSVVGYLGEIRAVAMLKQLTKGAKDISTRGTGNLRDAIKGQEIPIDIVCAGHGFQIKNYSIKNNAVTFSNETKVPHMLSSRMNFSGSLYDILISLFGVYQYNQPFYQSTNTKKRTWPPKDLDLYTELYSEIYDGSDSLFYELKPLFDSRIPYMLKIADTFSVKGDENFFSEAVYFNTFYWINKKLIPSSYILEQLIEQLRNRSDAMFTTVYALTKPVRGFTYQKQPKQAGRGTMFDAANQLRMSYDITIDLSKIL